MLNNVNSRRLSKPNILKLLISLEQQALTLLKTDEILENQQPKPLIVHAGTNDLTNDVNLLNNVKKNSK